MRVGRQVPLRDSAFEGFSRIYLSPELRARPFDASPTPSLFVNPPLDNDVNLCVIYLHFISPARNLAKVCILPFGIPPRSARVSQDLHAPWRCSTPPLSALESSSLFREPSLLISFSPLRHYGDQLMEVTDRRFQFGGNASPICAMMGNFCAGRRRKEKRAFGLGKLGNSRSITPDFCSVFLRTLNAKIFLHSGRSTAAIHSSTYF